MTAPKSVGLLACRVVLANARANGIAASRLAVQAQATIDALIDLERQLVHEEEIAARKAERATKKPRKT